MNNKEEKIKHFDASGIGATDSNIFGLPFTVEEAELVIIPFPWEVTVSYSAGTANGPQAIFDASKQIDLYEPFIKDAWKLGIAMEEVSQSWLKKSNELRSKAETYIEMFAKGEKPEINTVMKSIQNEIHNGCNDFHTWVKERCLQHLNNNKLVVGLGGDHSTPLGLMQALAEKHESFAILQLDAHCDLRNAYEGFEYSHASIMYNALKIPAVSKLVQVGIRDYCEDEVKLIEQSNGRVTTFFDRHIKGLLYKGNTVEEIFQSILKELPQKVYLSFDIDALDPKLCPNTGTPVAGGLEFEQALFLVQLLVESGRQIIGFDLNEVAPAENNDWDANVGGRLLYRICNLMALSNGKFKDHK